MYVKQMHYFSKVNTHNGLQNNHKRRKLFGILKFKKRVEGTNVSSFTPTLKISATDGVMRQATITGTGQRLEDERRLCFRGKIS